MIRHSFTVNKPGDKGFTVNIFDGKLEKWTYDPKPSEAALVVPTNPKCTLGYNASRKTADGAVHNAGGSDLRKKRTALPQSSPGVRCPLGKAVIVTGPYGKRRNPMPGNLRVANIIYTAPPNYKAADEKECDVNLAKAVASSLNCAKTANLRAVAFVLMSAGKANGGKKSEEEVAEIIMKAIKKFKGYTDIKLVSICVLGEDKADVVKGVALNLGYVEDE